MSRPPCPCPLPLAQGPTGSFISQFPPLNHFPPKATSSWTEGLKTLCACGFLWASPKPARGRIVLFSKPGHPERDLHTHQTLNKSFLEVEKGAQGGGCPAGAHPRQWQTWDSNPGPHHQANHSYLASLQAEPSCCTLGEWGGDPCRVLVNAQPLRALSKPRYSPL